MRVSSRLGVLLMTVVSLGACAQRAPIGGNIVAVKPTAAATAGDVPIEVRAFRSDDGRPGEEIIGAMCSVTASYYKTQVKTPAQVILPLYGYASPTFTVQCAAPGYESGVQAVQPFNQTQSQMLQAGSSAGLLGVVVMGVAAGVSDARNHQFSYRNVDVLLRAKP